MKKSGFWYSLVVFSLLAIFFIVLHPIAIFDTDDWNFIGTLRIPIPLIGYWNPIKVFPEFFMPLLSYLGVFTIFQVIGNYCYSLSIINGLFICFIMTVYFTEFYFYICKKFNLSTAKSLLISIIFIGMHFCAVAHNGKDNVFLFYSYDMTCMYHYILSTLLNASLVMHLIRYGGLDKWGTFSKKHRRLLVLWIYLALFSSLYSNVVLASYVGVELLMRLIEELKNRNFRIKDYCTQNKSLLIVIIFWLSTFVIEKTGGRSVHHATNIPNNILSGMKQMLLWFWRLNILFMIFAVVVILCKIFLPKKDHLTENIRYLLALCLTTLYIILLSAVVNFSYVSRTDVILPISFWVLLTLMTFLGELSEKIKNTTIILAVLATVSIIGTMYYSNTYKEINYVNLPYKNCEAFVDDVISQFKTAESNGQSEMDLVLPAFDTDDNWPIADYADTTFSGIMYYHRIVKSRIGVTMVFSSEKNKEFGIE